MKEMEYIDRSLKILEYNKITEMLADCAVTDGAKASISVILLYSRILR